jgi:hypothetical protein
VVDKNIKKVGETLMSVVLRLAKKPVEGDALLEDNSLATAA